MSHYTANLTYTREFNPHFLYFRTMRLYIFVPVAIACGIVLGIAINFANIFLPRLHRPFVVYSLVVPSGTLFMVILMLVQNLPPEASDVAFLCGMACLWLTLGAWSEDRIGHIQCFGLVGVTTPSKSGSISAQAYCEKMKVIEAFSWLAFLLILGLAYFAYKYVIEHDVYGRYFPGAPIQASQFGGYGNSSIYSAVPPAPGQPQYVVQQQPGHSVVIQPSANGQPAVQHVPSAPPTGRYI